MSLRSEDHAVPPTTESGLESAYRLLSWMPAVWLLIFFTLVLGVTVQQGHLPRYGIPDPKDTGVLRLIYSATILLFPMVLASLPIWFTMTLLSLTHRIRLPIRWQMPVIYLLGLCVIAMLAVLNPGGLITWLGD